MDTINVNGFQYFGVCMFNHKAIMGYIFEEGDKHVYYLFYIFS